ncbi:MAG: TraR/DksA family transcriptional regulator [Pirellula staleyi]
MADYSTLKTELETKLAELLERAEGIEEQLSDPGEKDWEENAIAKEGDETLAAVGNVTETEIRDIRRALQRIETGEYGICTVCEKPIAKARMAAVPWATRCVSCA